LDKYVELRQAGDNSPEGTIPEIDTRLEAIVERMLAGCCADKQWHQALGICLEARRLKKLEEVVRASDDICGSLCYALDATKSVVSRHVREAALRLIVRIFEEVGTLGTLEASDWIRLCQQLVVLDEPDKVAIILSRLIESNDHKKMMLALQISFDLFDNDVYVRFQVF
jgi:26S proteasome regulatory subunit N2